MSSIKLKNIVKKFDDKTIIPHLNFEIKKGDFTVLLGPSGCGKTTTLRMIAGLEKQSEGEIYIDDKEVTSLNPDKRGISMVFQSYALFPHLNVRENILFGLKVRKVPKKEQHKRLEEVSELVGLENHLLHKPAQLSGGQKQRVALARAFVAKNSICLMDEPLSNLDAKLRNEMRMEIKKLQRSLNMTVLYITHDQTEAMSMADWIVLLNKGEIEQQGKPSELYNRCATTFVGKFIGTPPMNILQLEKKNEKVYIHGQEYFSNCLNFIVKEDTFLGIRPEDIFFSSPNEGFEGRVVFQDYHGSDTIYAVQNLANDLPRPILLRVPKDTQKTHSDKIWINWKESKVHIFNSKGERREV